MRTKKVNRYWCDYCNKAGLSKAAMERHEKHCTLNPSRACRVCDLMNGGSHGIAVSELVALLPDSAPYHAACAMTSCGDEHWQATNDLAIAAKAALPALRDAVSDCPACVMAALRQAKIPIPMVDDFDFKKEMGEIFSNINDERFQCAAH